MKLDEIINRYCVPFDRENIARKAAIARGCPKDLIIGEWDRKLKESEILKRWVDEDITKIFNDEEEVANHFYPLATILGGLLEEQTGYTNIPFSHSVRDEEIKGEVKHCVITGDTSTIIDTHITGELTYKHGKPLLPPLQAYTGNAMNKYIMRLCFFHYVARGIFHTPFNRAIVFIVQRRNSHNDFEVNHRLKDTPALMNFTRNCITKGTQTYQTIKLRFDLDRLATTDLYRDFTEKVL